jgi:flagellar protein FlgJ
MDINNQLKSQLEMTRNFHDVKGLDSLRQAALSGDKEALQEAANQFEAIFVQMMLKSMRKAQDAMADKDSPFNSEQVKFYRGMHDQQLAVDLSSTGSIGLADIIVKQLSPNEGGYLPASVIRNDANLADIRRLQSLPASNEHVSKVNEITQQKESKQSAFSSPQEFISQLLPKAKEFAQELGISAQALLAQAAVETGWGKYMIHDQQGQNSHNLFGIKADRQWQGNKATVDTLEYQQGVTQKQKAAFRSYDSFSDSMADYVSFVKDNPRYQKALDNVTEPKDYFNALQEAGYATDPNYAKKVMSVLGNSIFSIVAEQLEKR